MEGPSSLCRGRPLHCARLHSCLSGAHVIRRPCAAFSLQRGRCLIAGAVQEVAVSLSPILPNPVLLELEDAAVESLLRWLSGMHVNMKVLPQPAMVHYDLYLEGQAQQPWGRLLTAGVEGPDAAGSPTTLVAVVVQPCCSSTPGSSSHPLSPSTPGGISAPSPEPCAVPSSGVEVAAPRPDPGSHECAAPLLAMHWGVTGTPGAPWEAPPPGWFTWPDASEDAGGGAWRSPLAFLPPRLGASGQPTQALVLQLPQDGTLECREDGAGFTFVLCDATCSSWFKVMAEHPASGSGPGLRDVFVDLSGLPSFIAATDALRPSSPIRAISP